MTTGGRFDFDDGGTYCGGWEDGKAHGYGVCTGPKGQGEYAGAWHCGYEISGIYTWTSGNNYRGQWTQGKRHGIGVETKGRWVYRGEWTQGFKGRYGVRQSTTTGATYEGTWTTGLQDGYGVETYADGGTYQGQWLRGIRHGYGMRQSVPYGLAAHCRQKSAVRESLTSLRSEQEDDQVVKDRDRKIDESRGGFVLTGASMPPPGSADSLKRRSPGLGGTLDKSVGRSSLRKTIVEGLKLRKQRSTGDIQESTQMRIGGSRPGGSVRSTVSSTSRASSVESNQSGMTAASVHTDSNASFISQDDVADLNMVEIYSGEWKNDKRSGFGVVERSDGLKYEGEWEGNRKHGYGATTFRDGTREEGKYKNNVLTTSGRRSRLFILRANKLKDRVENAVAAANRAAQIAQQKSDIAISRMASARAKAEQAQQAALKAQTDAEKARAKAHSYDPNFIQPGIDIMRKDAEASQLHQQHLQEQRNNHSAALVGNHVAPSSLPVEPTRPGIVENHITPLQSSAIAASKNILSKVGLNIGSEPANPNRSSLVASALAMAAVDSAIAGGGPAAIAMKKAQQTNAGPATTDQHRLATIASNRQPQQQQQHPAVENSIVADHVNPTTSRTPTHNSNNSRKPYNDDQPDLNDASRFSQLLDATVIDDHFDQYLMASPSTARSTRLSATPAARSGNVTANKPNGSVPGFSYDNRLSSNPVPAPANAAAAVDSDVDINDYGGRPLTRRKTLPGGTHGPLLIGATGAGLPPTSTVVSPARNVAVLQQAAPAATAVVRRGPFRPVQPSPPVAAQAAAQAPVVRRPAPIAGGFLRRAGGSNMGSMPDVAASSVAVSGGLPMPREEVHVLSQRRREELRRLREEAERRQQQDIVLRFGDIKEWCQERQLLVLVVALNISLATMFFSLLSR